MSATGPSELSRFFTLAEAVIVEIERIAAGATAFLQAGVHQPTERDRVMLALACKGDGSFRALIEDCRAGRGEAMHHLKTMTEVFIYFYVVGADDTDKTANGVLAECVAKPNAYRLGELEPGSENHATWERLRDEYRKDSAQIDNLARLAEQHGMRPWYAQVYRLACQSAHLGDLLSWMPADDGQLVVGNLAIGNPGRWQARLAISYGIQIALGLLGTISKTNIAGLAIDTSGFRQELQKIRDAAK